MGGGRKQQPKTVTAAAATKALAEQRKINAQVR
jgi:hypothetical protein